MSQRGTGQLRVMRGGNRIWLAACFLSLGAASSALAGTLYVTPGSDAGGDGLSWATAKHSVQAAIAVAGSGDTIWVAAGTYYGCVTVSKPVALYGGFAGDETALEQRDWTTNVTTLDGMKTRDRDTIAIGYGISDVVVDGFTICNGHVCGVEAYGNGTIIAHNRIVQNGCGVGASQNAVIRDNVVAYNLGGISFAWSGTALIAGNDIHHNSGWGISFNTYGAVVVSNNRIADNAGGIGCFADAEISGNLILRCTARDGAGLYIANDCHPTVTRNSFINNTAENYGGGVYAYDEAVLTNNVFVGNYARLGGGVYAHTLISRNNTFVGNTAADVHYRNHGGAAYIRGGDISNTLLAYNDTGLHYNPASTTFRNNCAWGNRAASYMSSADPTGTNGNIALDPQFVDLAFGNLRLQPGSPCIDAGGHGTIPPEELDRDGRPRAIGRVDIGAYESDGTTYAAGPYVIVRVSPDGDDARDGSSWADAKRTIQAALDVAADAGGEVWVREGTYLERVAMLPFAQLYGGFAGTESVRDDRDPAARPTILDGQQQAPIVRVAPGAPGAVVDGFTIRNGGYSYVAGASGIRGSYATVRIANNRFENDTGHFAVACESGSIDVADSVFVGCYGAIACSGAARIARCTLRGNTCGISIGGGPAAIEDCLITGCTEAHTGAVQPVEAVCTLKRCTIVGNSSRFGVYAACVERGSCEIADCIIAFNNAGLDAYGHPEDLRIHNNCIYGNRQYDHKILWPELTDPIGLDGNISADPRFMNINAGPDGLWGTPDDVLNDLHLRADSPCIDAGDPDYVAEPGAVDLDGAARLYDFDRDGLPRVDMGAFEAHFTTGDANCDGVVNWRDIDYFTAGLNDREAKWRKQFAEPGPACSYWNLDCNGDGHVSGRDIAAFVKLVRN